MEAHIAAADEQLLPGISYKLPSAASFITERRSSTFFNEGGNSYSPAGVKVLRFSLSDPTAYLDPHTACLALTITNNSSTTPLEFRSHNPMTMFSRCRVLMGGTLVEDINYFGRVQAQLDLWTPPARRATMECLLGVPREAATAPDLYAASYAPHVIAPGANLKICYPIRTGLFQQHLAIPLRYAGPVVLEFELSSNVSGFTKVGSSTDFTLTDCRVLADVFTIDDSLQEKVSKHLMSSGSLPISFSSWSTTMNVISPSHVNGAFSIQLARAFSRVKTLYASMATINDDGTQSYQWFHPIDAAQYNPDRDTLQWQYMVGSRSMPDHACRSVAESAMHLLKSLNLTAAEEGLGHKPEEFYSNKFFMAYDCERAATGPGGGAAYSGLSTRGGETIRLEVKGINTGNGNAPTRCWVTIHHEILVNIKLDSVEVFD